MPSVLRLSGLLLGVAFVLLGARRARGRGTGSRVPSLISLVAGMALVSVALFPDLARPLEDVFGLAGAPLGRLVSVMVVANACVFALALYAVSRADRSNQRVGRLVTAQAIAEVVRHEGLVPGVLVCVPAYNEAEGLREVLAGIPATLAGAPARTLVVDDGSTDATGAIAASAGALVARHPINLGGGAALRTAYGIASALGTTIVVTFDADGQHDPAEMESLVAPIVDGRADFVVGSRVLGSAEATSLPRSVGVRSFTWLINRLGASHLTDVASGYRAIRVARLAGLAFGEEQFHNPELLFGAIRSGLRIEEVPITIRRRAFGTTKKGRDLRYGLGFLRVVIRSWLR